MRVTQHFRDGSVPHLFFKDKGGKQNHMEVTVHHDDPFHIRLVFSNGRDIPKEARVLKGVPLLEIVIDGKPVAFIDKQGNDVLSKKTFHGTVHIRFRIMHVSRRHLQRNFKLVFVNKRGETIGSTVPIEVRSKLKTYQTCENGTVKRKKDATVPPRAAKKARVVENDHDVSSDMFNKLVNHCLVMSRQIQEQHEIIMRLSERLDAVDVVHTAEMLDVVNYL